MRSRFSWGAKTPSKSKKTKLYVRTHRVASSDLFPGHYPPSSRYLWFTKNEFNNLVAANNEYITSRLNYLEKITDYAGIASGKIREYIRTKAAEVYEAQIDHFTEAQVQNICNNLTQEDFNCIKQAADSSWHESDRSNCSALSVNEIVNLVQYWDLHFRELMTGLINARFF